MLSQLPFRTNQLFSTDKLQCNLDYPDTFVQGAHAVIGASLSEPHIDGTCVRDLFIWYVSYGTYVVTRCAAHTQYTVRVPKYSAQYRPHVVMFACSTAQACSVNCHVFKLKARICKIFEEILS